jgi:hypothetical protein
MKPDIIIKLIAAFEATIYTDFFYHPCCDMSGRRNSRCVVPNDEGGLMTGADDGGHVGISCLF